MVAVIINILYIPGRMVAVIINILYLPGTNQICSGIQFATHFIEFFVVETKRFVGSTANVILTL